MNSDQRKTWVKELFTLHEGRLLRYTMRFTVESHAKEIVQESFLQLLKFETPAKLEGKELAWLFRVCRNRALDRLKKEGRMKNMESGDDIPFEGENADQKISRRENISMTGELLKVLTPTQKEVVRLKFQEELSYKQISEITGHSVSHVGVILHQAIGKLRSHMVQKSEPQTMEVDSEKRSHK